MKAFKSRFSRMRLKMIQLGLFLLSTQVLFPQEAQSINPILTDKFIINAGLFSTLSTLKINAIGEGTDGGRLEEIDFDEQFNINDYQNTFSLTFTWRFAKNWNLSAEYFGVNRESEVVLKEDIEWRDVTFKKGTGVKGGFDFALYRAFIGRVIARGDHFEFGGGLGAHTIRISPFMEGQAFINDQDFEYQRNRVSSTLPLPNIGLWFIYAPTEKLSLSTRLDWFGIKVDNTAGELWDITPTLSYQVFRNVGVSVGYKYLTFGVDVEKPRWQKNIDLQFKGPSFSLFGNF